MTLAGKLRAISQQIDDWAAAKIGLIDWGKNQVYIDQAAARIEAGNKSSLRRRPMKSAPKDGRMIILTIDHGWTGEEVEVPGAWMAPGGDPSLIGWWAASLVTGDGSLDGLPHRINEGAIIPKKWRPLTERRYNPEDPS